MSFSFGQTGGSGSGSNTPNKPLFGATSSGGTGSLFGGTTNANTGSSTPSGPNLFGSANTGSSSTLFGNTSSNAPAASKPGGVFGGNQATSGASQPVSSSFSFGNVGGANAAKPTLFGGAGTSGTTVATTGGTTSTSTPTFSFGNTAASSTPAATPAANKTFSLPSTTPAGPPPGTSLFGGQSAQTGTSASSQAPSLFGTKPATASTPTTSPFGAAASSSTPAKPLGSTPGGSGLFSFGNKDATADANKSTPTQPSPAPTNIFGGAAQSGASGGQGTQATPKPSLFGNLGSTTPSSTPASKPPAFSLGATPASAQPASSQPSATTPANPLSLGGDRSTPVSTGAPASNMFSAASAGSGPSGGSGSGGFGFLKPGGNAPASTAAPLGGSTASPGAGTATTATSGLSLFPSLGGGASAASSGAASTSTAAPGLFSLGGAKPAGTTAQPSTSTNTTAPAASFGGTTTTAGGDAAKSGLASSTAGPAPSAQSRLKNKSMDEIITRWAADLSKYQKEFQTQADTVAKWDRALVENSDKVKQLYSKTFQAERDAAEVERQLTMMEENQQELDQYLDRYEKEIENLMKIHGVGGRSDGLRGPDQERERTYKLAEKLQDRLNELNKDLTEMIEEINSTSQTLSKTGKPDDPLTKVVRVLNSQLSQLQLIDSGAAQLQEKIDAARKESQRVGANGWNGLGTDPAEDFYRSYRGGRTDRFGGVS